MSEWNSANPWQNRTGGLMLGLSGEQVAVHLGELLTEHTDDAQATLKQAVERWAHTEADRLGLSQAGRIVDDLRRAAMATGSAASAKSLAMVAHEVDHRVRELGIDPEQWATELARGSEAARRARNLINHRRKCVNGVLGSLIAKPKTSARTTQRPANAEQLQRAFELGLRSIGTPADLGHWATAAFEHYADILRQQEMSTNSDALIANQRMEWFGFIWLCRDDVELDEFDEDAVRSRPSFDVRFHRAIAQLDSEMRKTQRPRSSQWASNPSGLNDAPNFSSEPSFAGAGDEQQHAHSFSSEVSGLNASPVLETVTGPRAASEAAAAGPAPAQASSAAAFAALPRLSVKRDVDGVTLLLNADAFGVADLDGAAVMLSLMLMDPNDTTTVVVRAIEHPERQLEVKLATLDPQRVQAAFVRAQELLKG